MPTQRLLPKNIDKGIVVCGHRHGHCIDIMRSLGTLRTVQFGPDSVGEHEQGFLTNQNRFVDKIEAAEIISTDNYNHNKYHGHNRQSS